MECRERAYKYVAYSAVTFSLVAILSVCITMPIVYNFVDHIQQQTKQELEFCKVSHLFQNIYILMTNISDTLFAFRRPGELS